MVPDPPSVPGARRSARARSASLDAALSLASEVPWPRVTMEAIAARAGVGKATLYRWWPSRGAVLVEALADRNARDTAYGLPDTGDLERDLATVLRGVVDELADPAWSSLLRALTVETLGDEDLRGQVLATIFTPQVEAFGRRLATARSQGLVADDTDDLAAMEVIVAPVFHRWQQGSGVLDHAYADAVAARACRALLTSSPPR